MSIIAWKTWQRSRKLRDSISFVPRKEREQARNGAGPSDPGLASLTWNSRWR